MRALRSKRFLRLAVSLLGLSLLPAIIAPVARAGECTSRSSDRGLVCVPVRPVVSGLTDREKQEGALPASIVDDLFSHLGKSRSLSPHAPAPNAFLVLAQIITADAPNRHDRTLLTGIVQDHNPTVYILLQGSLVFADQNIPHGKDYLLTTERSMGP